VGESTRSVPEAVVGVVHDGGRFLLIKRAMTTPAAGYWAPPSGRIESTETAAEAVVREMREELGLEVRALREVWTCSSHDGSFMLHWWLLANEGTHIQPNRREVADVRWCTVKEIVALAPTFQDDVRFFVEVWPTLSAD
jgi:8-oxo-dGTP diphosphatase